MGHSPREKNHLEIPSIAVKSTVHCPLSTVHYPISIIPYPLSHIHYPISIILLVFLAVNGRSGAGVGEKGFGKAERGGVTHGLGHLVEC